MTEKDGALFASIVLLINLMTLLTITARTHCLDPLQEARCLNCIRNVTGLLGIDVTKRCEGYYCGQYQLSYSYWVEAGKPGSSQGARDFEKCARDKGCAEQAVKAYFKKFRRDCNSDGAVDCHDMAALHKAGPGSCASDWFYKSRYWQAFNRTICATNRDQPSEDIRVELEELNRQPVREMKNQSLTQDCLDCICDAVSGCNTSVNNCGSGAVCGPFAISQTYWKDGRKPGASWTACARTKECSMVTVKNYMEKNKRDCNGDGLITCEDYAAIHRRGPRACINRDLFKDHYWNKFQACRASQKPQKDVNMVKVYEENDDAANQNSLASRDDNGISTQSLQPATQPASVVVTSAPSSTPVSPTQPTTTTTSTTTTTTTTTSTPTTSTIATTTTTTPGPTTSEPVMDSYQHQSFQPLAHEHQHQQQQQQQQESESSSHVLDLSPNSAESSQTADGYTTATSQMLSTIASTTPKRVETASPASVVVLDQAEIVYSVPNFPFAMPSDFDKATSFDRVATGIFASPDFTKSVTNSVKPKPSMHNQKSPTDPHQQQLVDRASGQGGDQSTGLSQSIWGPDSMNISNLFDKGLNDSGRIASECLECICDASSNCDTTVQCISKQREKNRCGLYMISWNQYQESDISLTSLVSAPTGLNEETLDEKLYYECTTDRACAEKLIHLYIEKHQKDCNNDGKIDCYDIAAIHRVGPDSCNSGKFLSSQYWKDFNICYATDRFSTTTTQASIVAAATTITAGKNIPSASGA